MSLDCESETPAGSPTSRSSMDSRKFFFDRLFSAEATDDEVFSVVREEVSRALAGEAACVVAYGVASSGKTHNLLALAERASEELEEMTATVRLEGVQVEVSAQVV